MAMSRKDYVKFAALFAGELELAKSEANSWNRVRGIVHSTADIFAQDNPRFDRDKFYAASGMI